MIANGLPVWNGEPVFLLGGVDCVMRRKARAKQNRYLQSTRPLCRPSRVMLRHALAEFPGPAPPSRASPLAFRKERPIQRAERGVYPVQVAAPVCREEAIGDSDLVDGQPGIALQGCAHVGARWTHLGVTTSKIGREVGACIAESVPDDRRLEVVANALPIWGGLQIAVGTTFISPVRARGTTASPARRACQQGQENFTEIRHGAIAARYAGGRQTN